MKNVSWLVVALVMVVACVGGASPALAQDGPPVTDVVLKVRNADNPTQIAVENVTAIGAWTCNQAPVPAPTGDVANPTLASYIDPVNAGRECHYRAAPGQPLFALPFGTTRYNATATFRNAIGDGPESAPSGFFTRPGSAPSVAPAGLKLTAGQ